MIWTALQKYSTMLIKFISGIILARLLTPFDYGCIGMLSIFMVVSETFINGGFGAALIQKKHPTQEDYSTVFFFNMGMSVLLYGILYFCAPIIARFYKIPLLSDVLRVQGIILFIYAFNLIQQNQLQKKLNFKVLSLVTITTSLVALAVTVYMAYHNYGVWALVAQNIVVAAIPALVFWYYIKWRPSWTFSVKSFKELFGFGFFMFLTHLVNNISQQIQGLLIGRLYNATTMGYYAKAESTEKLASRSISQVMTQVTYPIYAEVQDDKARLIHIIEQLTGVVAYLTFPLMFALILVAKPLFILLYSDRWLDSIPFFQVLCLAGLGMCLHSVNLQSISAIGKSRSLFSWSIIKHSVGLVFMIGGLLIFGIKGLLWGTVLNQWNSALINMFLVSKHIGYKVRTQLWKLLPTALASVTAFLTSFIICRHLGFGLYLTGGIQLGIFVAVYLGWSLVFKPAPYKALLSIVSSKK